MKKLKLIIIIALIIIGIFLGSTIFLNYQNQRKMEEIIYGDRILQETTINDYIANKEEILEIANFISKYEKAEEEEIHIEKNNSVSITVWNRHGYIEVTEDINKEIQQCSDILFNQSVFTKIYDSRSSENCIVFETESKAFQFYNGIIFTSNNKIPDCNFGKVEKLEKIEDNVYYFEGE